MSYDLYVDQPQGDLATQLRLLVTKDEPLTDYLSLMHGQFDKKKKQFVKRGEFNQHIASNLARLQSLDIGQAVIPNMALLPAGSWFLQFAFTLAKPWMSKDDAPFCVTDSVNPVRKDRVFMAPMMAAAGWKGLLRWTLMHVHLAQRKDSLTPEGFATARFVQTLLFGDEQGEEPAQAKGFARYVDDLKPEACTAYERLLRRYYGIKPDEPLPHHSGWLMFYPTFFDLIDVEVINPHSRRTRAGTHPIYLECVPEGAKGVFSLLYVPFDLIGQDSVSVKDEAGRHLRYLAPAIREMFLTYGFSARCTSGYGVAKDEIQGTVKTWAGGKPLTSLSHLAQEVKDVAG